MLDSLDMCGDHVCGGYTLNVRTAVPKRGLAIRISKITADLGGSVVRLRQYTSRSHTQFMEDEWMVGKYIFGIEYFWKIN